MAFVSVFKDDRPILRLMMMNKWILRREIHLSVSPAKDRLCVLTSLCSCQPSKRKLPSPLSSSYTNRIINYMSNIILTSLTSKQTISGMHDIPFDFVIIYGCEWRNVECEDSIRRSGIQQASQSQQKSTGAEQGRSTSNRSRQYRLARACEIVVHSSNALVE